MKVPQRQFLNQIEKYGLSNSFGHNEEKNYKEVAPILRNQHFHMFNKNLTPGQEGNTTSVLENAKTQITTYYRARLQDVFTRHFPDCEISSLEILISQIVEVKMHSVEWLLNQSSERKQDVYILPDGLTTAQYNAIQGKLHPDLSLSEAKELNDLFVMAKKTESLVERRAKALIKYIHEYGLILDDQRLAKTIQPSHGTIKYDQWVLNSGELNQFISRVEDNVCLTRNRMVKITHGSKCESFHPSKKIMSLVDSDSLKTECTSATVEGQINFTGTGNDTRTFEAIPKAGQDPQSSYILKINCDIVGLTHLQPHLEEKNEEDRELHLGANCSAKIISTLRECESQLQTPEFDWSTEDDITIWYGYLHSLSKFNNRYFNIIDIKNNHELNEMEGIFRMVITAYEDGIASVTRTRKPTA